MGFALFLIYIAATFLRPAELFPGLSTYRVMVVSGAATGLASLITLFLGRGPRLAASRVLLVVCFWLWAGFSVLAHDGWLGGALLALDGLSSTIFVYFLVLVNVTTLGRVRIFAATLVLLAIVAGGEGVLGFHVGFREDLFVVHELVDEEGEHIELDPRGAEAAAEADRPVVKRIRSLGFLNDPNDLAQAIVCVLPLLILLGAGGRLRRTVVIGLPGAVLLYALYLTRSRGGAISLLTLGILLVQNRLGWTASLLLGGAVTFLGAGMTLGGRSFVLDESAHGRLASWSEGIQMLRASPVWGIGYRNYVDQSDLVAHNSFVHCFAELGLVGYALWLGMLFMTLVGIRSLEKRSEDGFDRNLASWALACRISVVSFLTAALFLSRTYSVTLFMLLGLGDALASIARGQGRAVAGFTPLGWLWRIGAIEALTIALAYATVLLLR